VEISQELKDSSSCIWVTSYMEVWIETAWSDYALRWAKENGHTEVTEYLRYIKNNKEGKNEIS
jgi:hypothetical protein